jgi:hypothetical protein
MFFLAGTLICFYLLFQPKLATLPDISASFWFILRGYRPAPVAAARWTRSHRQRRPFNGS